MTRCGRCGRERVVEITIDDSQDVCGHTFTAALPARRCEACLQITIQGTDMKLFELRIACELARAGLRSAGVEGAIVGKALYAGAFTLQEAHNEMSAVTGAA